jgi:hypothetical protein
VPSGRITFHRQVMSVDKMPHWASSDKRYIFYHHFIMIHTPTNHTQRIVKVKTFDEGIIEDCIDAVLQVDFANANIGGGVSRGVK